MTAIRFAVAATAALALTGLALAPASACPGMKWDHTSDKMAMTAPMSPVDTTTLPTDADAVDQSITTHDPDTGTEATTPDAQQ